MSPKIIFRLTGAAALCCTVTANAGNLLDPEIGADILLDQEIDAGILLDQDFDAGTLLDQDFDAVLPSDGSYLATTLVSTSAAPVASASALTGASSTVSALSAAPVSGPVDLKVLLSQFVDIPVSGSAADNLRYSGRVDAFLNVTGGAFGLDDSFTLTIRPEFTWGETPNGRIGLIPGNAALFRVLNEGSFDLSASVTKRWTSGTALTVGKVNRFDHTAELPIVGSNGHFGFMNIGVALPQTAIIPNTLTGAFLEVPTDKADFRFWVFDPDFQFERTGLEDPFSSGVGFFGSVTVPVQLGGQPGFYSLELTGSTRNDVNTSLAGPALAPPPGADFGNSRGEYAVAVNGSQFISTYADAPDKGWGVFGRVYISNGDPTFLGWSGTIGVSGNPRFRLQDRFGVAWFRYSITEGLVRAQAGRIPLEDEEGVEVFYTLGGIADRFELTANLQVVDPALSFRETGVLVGMRLSAGF